ADHLVNPGSTAPVAASTATSTPARSGTTGANTTSNVTASTIDAATEHAYAAASPSIVYVVNTGVGSGSGVIYDTKGDIVTNNHVVSGGSKFSVTLNNGKTYAATLVGTDAADDLAVIHINASGLTPAHFAAAGGYQVAEGVLAIGSPLGLKQSVSFGLISGLNRVEQEPNGSYISNAIQTSAPINPGNSGGALVSLDGTVVGIPTLEQTSSQDGSAAQNIGFAIPSDRVTTIADQIIATGKVEHTGRPYLGIAPTDATGQSSSGLGNLSPFGGSTPSVSGALVQQISSNGPAAQAGVQQGDVITAADGTTVTDAQDLLTVLAQKKPGDTISLTINRNGSTVHVQVKLGELPA
ncbi:MAG TPA: trypsin-like peptidase domain-containing protein, partial [Chloroflexota bacterium]